MSASLKMWPNGQTVWASYGPWAAVPVATGPTPESTVRVCRKLTTEFLEEGRWWSALAVTEKGNGFREALREVGTPDDYKHFARQRLKAWAIGRASRSAV